MNFLLFPQTVSAMDWCQSIAAALVFCVFFAGGNTDAETLKCKLTQNGDEMTYSISDDSRAPEINKSECDYAWINGSDITIANNENHMSPVKSKSINSLNTSQCVQGLISRQECFSKTTGSPINYFANCTEACTGKDTSPPKKDGLSNKWIAAIIGICVVAVLVVAVGLCYRFKEKIWRSGGFNQCGGRYTTVKMANMNPKPTDDV